MAVTSFAVTPVHSFQVMMKREKSSRMAIGTNNHYRIEDIHGRHFMETAQAAGLPKAMARAAIEETVTSAHNALKQVQEPLPRAFPTAIHAAVSRAVASRVSVFASLT